MKNKDLNNISDFLLGKWINKDLSEEEMKDISQWANSSDENSKYFKDIENIKNDLDELELMSSIDSKLGIAKVKSRIKPSYKKVSLVSKFLFYGQKVAAIIVIPLLIFSIYQLSTQVNLGDNDKLVWQEIYTPIGLRSSYELPDGTKVWLNGNTYLRYPSRFLQKERQVELTGEAFFEVHSDKKHPFVVNTGKFSVQAVGTKFNVRALCKDSIIETALVEGNVNLLKNTPSGTKKLYALKPNHLAKYDEKTQKLKVYQTNLDKYLAWKENQIMFNDDPITEVLKRLGQWYNVDFEISEDIVSRNYAYTGLFTDEGLPQILEYIELTTPVKFKYTPLKRKEDSSYIKRKIIVTLK